MKQQDEIAALNRAQEKAEARVSSIHKQLTASESELSVLEEEMDEVWLNVFSGPRVSADSCCDKKTVYEGLRNCPCLLSSSRASTLRCSCPSRSSGFHV